MSTMTKATQILLMLMLWVLGGGTMLSARESPLRAFLVLLGLSLVVFVTNSTFAASRVRRGKPDDLSMTFSDVASLNGKDWRQLASATLIGLGMVAFSLVAFRGGA
jgi:hypothetical protein